MTQSKEEQKEMNTSSPTNENDVEIARIKAEIAKYEFELGSKLIEKNEDKKYKSQNLDRIISAAEKLGLGAMVLAGITLVNKERYAAVDRMADRMDE